MPQETNLFNEETPFIDGQIKAIFFQNPSNYYKVLLVKIQETNLEGLDDEIVVTGNFGETQEEESYHFEGKVVDHPRYGRQFQAETYHKEKPSTKLGVIQYLSSDKFPGIGKITAEKIVDIYGINAIDEMLQDPSRLTEIKSLKNEKREMLLRVLKENLGMEQVIIGLNDLGFGTQLAFQIYQTYHEDQEDVLAYIKENPYQLVIDIDGVGFVKADNLASNLGIAPDSPQRIQACILHVILQDAQTSGNTYMEAKDLLELVLDTLEKARPFEIAPDLVAENIIQLANLGALQQEGTKVYENSVYFSEVGIANSLERLLATKDNLTYPKDEMEKAFTTVEKSLGIHYGESQKAAIFEALLNPVFILTGGPGTGKTTIVRGIVEMYGELNGLSLDPKDYNDQPFPVLLGAPTGRAAKRLNETTQLPSGTIHRLLGLTGREKYPQEIYRELEGGLLIIDEMSMVDTWLANTLLKAVPNEMQVIFVGDKDQLPSVGPGQVLHDLLEVAKIPKAELTEIFRQGDGSSIIPLAHAIKVGELPADFRENKKDRSYFPSDAYHIEHLIGQIAEKAKKKNFNISDIQVLAPMYKGPAGIDALNKMLQNIFNGNPDGKKKEVVYMDTVYRIGDKVLQLVNSPELNVFNGDMGIITGLTLAKDTEDKIDELIIEFDGGEVTYSRNEWNKITLSYCCSIHKAQGSEFEMVILPMVRQYSRMLQRNLLYTAITRSRNLLILLGEESAFETCVKHQSASRKTSLVEKITGEMSSDQRVALENYEKGEQVVAPGSPVVEEKEKPEEKVVTRVENVNQVEEAAADEIPLFDLNNMGQTVDVVEDYVLTVDNLLLIDPMIGMDGVRPEDFVEKEA